MKDRNGRSLSCSSTRKVTSSKLLGFLICLPAAATALQLPPVGPLNPPSQPSSSRDTGHTFTLRHIFHRGTYQDPYLHRRLDIRPDSEVVVAFEDEQPYIAPPPRLTAKSEPLHIERLTDRRWTSIEQHLDYASLTGVPAILDASQWSLDQVDGPDVTDQETVINLALMAANAYAPTVGEGEWTNVTQGYNHSTSFGWEGDGLRGHIFADEGNRTVIIGLKGTSPAVFDGDGTTTRDKLNDNLFFSCCCAQGGQYFWRQVCDCQSATYSCNSTCLIKSLKEKTRYYGASIDLYTNVTELYPDSNVWIVGHSLGGAVSSLLGLTFGLPVVTFEAPGDDLAARRLGLPAPPDAHPNHPHRRKYTGARHFGHTADPIFMGTCNGAAAACTLGGYAMESQCHSGMQCVYDTVQDSGWRVGIGYHKIHVVIDDVIKKYKHVAKCEPDTECVDCYNWKFFKSNGSEERTTTTTTTTTSTSSRTRTSTCKTPGWWGCLDETTTGTTSTTPVITTTFTTTTCLTPGWFGCKESANLTVTTTTEAPTSAQSVPASTTSSSSCKPGWFGGGCDQTSTSTPAKTDSQSLMPTTSTTEGCKTPGFFFGCRDKHTHKHEQSSTDSTTATITPPPSNTPSSSAKPTSTVSEPKHKCKHPVFFGLICWDSISDVASSNEDHWRTDL